LLSLAGAEKHGYAIIKDVERLSASRIRLSTGTLYEALTRLLDLGWVERLDETAPVEEHPGLPRKLYRLTGQGLVILKGETRRLQELVAAARLRLGEDRA
jgi:DNA-binding PadR family transcriptional regulator